MKQDSTEPSSDHKLKQPDYPKSPLDIKMWHKRINLKHRMSLNNELGCSKFYQNGTLNGKYYDHKKAIPLTKKHKIGEKCMELLQIVVLQQLVLIKEQGVKCLGLPNKR